MNQTLPTCSELDLLDAFLRARTNTRSISPGLLGRSPAGLQRAPLTSLSSSLASSRLFSSDSIRRCSPSLEASAIASCPAEMRGGEEGAVESIESVPVVKSADRVVVVMVEVEVGVVRVEEEVVRRRRVLSDASERVRRR